jgi:hypothetical protein
MSCLWCRLTWTDTKKIIYGFGYLSGPTRKINFWKKHRHYVRKTHSKCAHMNNRDAQIARLHHCVLHYKVYWDTRKGASPNKIHMRRDLGRMLLSLKSNLRHALRECITYLIAGWGHCGSNRRHANGRTSPITWKLETRFKGVRHRFDYRLRPLWH